MSEHKSSTNHSPKIVNLQDIILKYAYDWYKKNEKKQVKCQFGRKSSHWANLIKEIDWTGLRARHEEVAVSNDMSSIQYSRKKDLSTTDTSTTTPLNQPLRNIRHVLFRSCFINDTDKDQSYNLRAERRTIAKCKISLNEGYKVEVGSSAALCVPLPNCVLKSSANLKTEYSMEDKIERDIEEELRWSAESVVKVASMSTTTAELIVHEDEYDGTFSVKSVFSGEIRVILKHPKTQAKLIEMNFNDLADIFTSEHGFQQLACNEAVSKISRGHCSARFGIDQRVELHQSPI